MWKAGKIFLILSMLWGNGISSTLSFEGGEERLEKEGMPISMVLRRSSATEMEGPITMRFSELEADEVDVFSEAHISDGMAVGSIKVEETGSTVSIKDFYLVSKMKELAVDHCVPLVLQHHYPGKTVIIAAPLRTS